MGGVIEFPKERPPVRLPKIGRAESEFASEVGSHLEKLEVGFRFNDHLVEIQDEPFDGELDKFKLARGGLKFKELRATRAKTWLEQYVETGLDVEVGKKPKQKIFMPKTMSKSQSEALLASPQFLKKIPPVDRILEIPIPIRTRTDDIVFPKSGFNQELAVYVAPDAPPLSEMPLEQALEILEKAQEGFCWKHSQSKVHAFARLLTPFARELIGFHERPPFWFFDANRPRCGKDYLNGVTQIIYLGHPFEDLPITDRPEETAKRIVSALRSGRRMMHFANCQNHLEDAALIQAITAPTINARSLGSNDAHSDLELPNEIDFSMSANMGLTYREDVEPRLRKIALAFFEEDPNKRPFPNPFLHEWLKRERVRVLSAIYSVFQHWIKSGAPHGKTIFNSFPAWAKILGGVMQAANLGDPCLPHQDEDLIGGDNRERAMRALFKACYDKIPEEWIKKSDIYDVIEEQVDSYPAFEWFGNPHTSSSGKIKKIDPLPLVLGAP